MEIQTHDVENAGQSGEEREKGLQRLWGGLKKNVEYRGKWAEINGSMGDLGTYIPIVIALTLVNGLDLGTTLIFTGAYNIITGLMFGVPMPVQPMKAIASVAISGGKDDHLNIPEIMAAGICTASCLLLLGITGLMGLMYRLIPLPVVRAVQLSQGLAFAMTAVKYIRKEQDLSKGKSIGTRPWLGLDGLLLALICFLFFILVNGSGSDNAKQAKGESEASLPTSTKGNGKKHGDSQESRDFVEKCERDDSCENVTSKSSKISRLLHGIPSAMIVFIIGIVLANLRKPSLLKHLKLGPSKPHLINITKSEWKRGFLKAAVPQIPLSVLNSVIAVCKLSVDLFPNKDVSATAVSVSVGLMNLVGCWFGCMPVCHGAGGLAGQYKFGARSGASVAFLGTLKVFLGLLVGSHVVEILKHYPIGLLGVLLLFSGIELALSCRDMCSKMDSFVMLMSTAVSLTGSSATLGFVFGIVLFVVLKIRELGFSGCFREFKKLLCAGRTMMSKYEFD